MSATKTRSKTKTIHMGLLLDESGSMAGNQKAVIDGTNEFVGSLQGEKNSEKTKVTISTFDNSAGQEMVRVIRDAEPLDDIELLDSEDYQPRGGTPLYDAIGKTIAAMEAGMHTRDRAMVVIFTDGYENASVEFDQPAIKALVERKEAEGWTFIFLGANIDARRVGATMGMGAQGQAINFVSTPKGLRGAMGPTGPAGSTGVAYLADGGEMPAAQTYSRNAKQFGDSVGEDGQAAASSTPEREPDEPEDTGDKASAYEQAREALGGE